MKKVKITTTLRPGIKDSPGTALEKVINSTDGLAANNVRIGKVIFLEVEDDTTDADIRSIAKLVTNPVMENFQIEIV